MKEKTLTALRYLYFYGPCYKADYLKLFGKRGAPVYDRLSKRILAEKGSPGFIERHIEAEGTKRQAHQTATIVALAPAGITYYKDKEIPGLDRLKSANTNLINTSQLKRILYPHLTDQKVFIMYFLAGISCFRCQKPSLGYLSYTLSHNAIRLERMPYRSEYLDRHFETMDSKQKEMTLKEFLKAGAFYSKKEVIEFLKLHGKNYTDSFKGISWHGLFVSDTNMLINFVLSYGENLRAYANSMMLGSLLQKLKDNLSPATNVFRRIPGITDSNRGIYENRIDAVTIGIGSSHTYAEAMGNKYGLIRKKDMSLLESETRPFDVIDCTSRRFSRIYSIDDRELGLSMLRYITGYSLEDYHHEEIALFEEDPRFQINRYSDAFPADYTPLNIQAIYLPVYEIKTLRKIADRARKENYPVVIVTRRQMMETIAHCVHIDTITSLDPGKPKQPGLFFLEYIEDEDNIFIGEFINENSGVFCIYDQKGFVKGKAMIDSYFAGKGLRLRSEGEYIRLARLCGEKLPEDTPESEVRCRFYNAIARSSPEEYLDRYQDQFGEDDDCPVRVDEIGERKKYRKQSYQSQIKLNLTRKDQERIRKLAEGCDTRMSALIRKNFLLLVDVAEKHAAEKGIKIADSFKILMKSVVQ